MQDHLWWPEGSLLSVMRGCGHYHYHETDELVDDAWKIKTWTLARVCVDVP